MVAHGVCSLLVKLLDMKMWDGYIPCMDTQCYPWFVLTHNVTPKLFTDFFVRLILTNLDWLSTMCEHTMLPVWSVPDLIIYRKIYFITASGFSGSKEFSCMAGTPWSNRIQICLMMRQAWILIVFVFADNPSKILSSPTSLLRVWCTRGWGKNS